MIGPRPEASFPRGAVVPVVPTLPEPGVHQARAGKRKPEKDLFSNKGNSGPKEKKAKKKDKSKKVQKSSLEISAVASLSYSQLGEGLVLLGYVSQVLEFELKVSLPGRLVGSLPITNISPAFNARIRAATEQEEQGGQAEELPALGQLYKEGAPLAVAVVACDRTEKGRWNVTLSLAPTRVLGPRAYAVGDLVSAAVASREDHGYIMDLGSNTLRGFVTSKAMAKINPAPTIGAVVWGVVTRTEAGAVTINPAPGKVWAAECAAPTAHNLLAGSKVRVTVEERLRNGLKVAMKGGLVGYIHCEQLQEVLQEPEEHEVGAELEARLLYILPTTNTIFLTLRGVRSAGLAGLRAGQVVEDAVVERSSAHCVVIRLAPDQYGLVNHRQLSEGREVLKHIKKKFPVGHKVTAKVLALDYSSGMAVCSLQKSLLSGVQRLDQLTIGQKLTATVKAFCPSGLVVTVGPGLTGLVPSLFLSDVLLSKPELKYLPGDKLACRVLRVDVAANKLQLTSKPILVNNEFTIVGSWAEAVAGAVTEGVVVKAGPEGLLLQLWGKMRGWVPRSQLSTETIDSPEKLFFLGQAVKCRVLEAEEARDRLSLSLVLGSHHQPLGRREKGGQLLELGAEYVATVTKVSEKGLEVTAEHDGAPCRASIPSLHLTDQASLAGQVRAGMEVGQKVVGRVWHKDVVTLITLKPSLLANWASLPKSMDEYEVGTVVPGVVQMVKKFGVFLRVPGLAKLVLAPTRLLQDYFLDTAEGVLEQGQTLYCKVVELDREAEKVTVATCLREVANKKDDGAAVLEDWLEVAAGLPCAWLPPDLRLGQAVNGTVTQVTEFGAVLDIGGVRGIVTASNLAGPDVAEGESLQGVVLHVDTAAQCVELGCAARLVGRAAARRGDLATGAVQVGAVLRGEVVLVKTEHSLAVVSVTAPRQHCGLLGVLGTRRHLNDLAGEEVTAGREVTVVVRAVTTRGELVLVTEKEVRKAGKRGRAESESEGARTRRGSESAAQPSGPGPDKPVEIEPISITSEKPKKSKKSKVAPTEDGAAVEEVESKTEAITKKKAKKVKKAEKDAPAEKVEPVAAPQDPGWDYSATCVTRPAWRSAAIWSDDEEEPEEEQERSHVSKTEAKRLRRVEEEEAGRLEQRLLDGEVEQPATEGEFERLVVASPDSSLVWVQYMAFCMQAGELEQARAVARRALVRINFRLEPERLNVFLAWLNLESTFGSEEAMAEVLKEALQCCDQYKVYCQVAVIYSQGGKTAEAEKTYKTMVRKFGREKEVWTKFAVFYFKAGKLNDGRFLLQRSKQSLEERDHVDIATKFAQIEFRYGDPERGKTLFETILSNFPRRTDLWSVYVDQLVKTGDPEAARQLYRRIATLDLQARKMKFLFKKWLDFELVHGTEAGVAEVKRGAQSYLETRGGQGEPEPS